MLTSRRRRWSARPVRTGAVIVPLAVALVAGGAAQAARPGGQAGRAPVITTIAGGVGGPGAATTVSLAEPGAGIGPCGLAASSGAVYVGDTTTVRKIGPKGWLTTPAGIDLLGGYVGFGEPATLAHLIDVCGVAVDAHGNLVIADAQPQLVLVVAASTGKFYGQAMTAGHVYTVAGTGGEGYSGDGGPARLADLSIPDAVAVDRSGNLVIADTGNFRVRVVAVRTGRFYGQAMTAGDIYTVAGCGCVAPLGDGGPAVKASLDYPESVAVDSAGNVLIADDQDHRIRVAAARTGTFYGQAMTAGRIYTIAGGGIAIPGDGGPATAASLLQARFVTLDAAGNVVIGDAGHARVQVVAVRTGSFYGQAMTAGDIYTIAGDGTAGFAGDGGPAASADLGGPCGVAVDAAGNVLITDSYRVRIVAEATGTAYGRAMTAGDIYTIAGDGADASGDRGPATRAELDNPGSVAVDAHGNTIIADTDSSRVRAVATTTGTFYGQAMTAGHIYTIAGNGTAGFAGDGGKATAAELNLPGGASIDRAGDVVIADTFGNRVRLVAAKTGDFFGRAMTAGDIYTIAGNGMIGFSGDRGAATAAELSGPVWASADRAGNVLVADTGNNRVRVVAARTGSFYGRTMTAGHIYTIAGGGQSGLGDGGKAVKAGLNSPGGITVDGAGSVLIADAFDGRVRVVAARTGTFYGRKMTARDIYTIAGGGTAALRDGRRATAVRLGCPEAVAFDRSGNLLIADECLRRVLVAAVRTGSFYDQRMTAGDIYTIAGPGGRSLGDGGRATSASLSELTGVAAESNGDVLIADTQDFRVRQVSI